MKIAKPFDRKQLLMMVDTFIKLRYGSYNEILDWSVRDMIEINIALDSKAKEQQISDALGF